MDASPEVGYNPPPEFQKDARDPLIELNLTDSSELWLIQWPINQPPDFGGQVVSLNLDNDGLLGSFEGSSGKSYDVVSFAAQEPDASVFLSSASESRTVGKISRRVSLVHYPDPSEIQKQNASNLKQMFERSSATSLTNSRHQFATPTRSSRPRQSQSASGRAASTHSSRRKSCLSEVGEPSETPSRRHIDGPTRSLDQSDQDSGHTHLPVTSSGSLERSQKKKSKKRRKTEG